MKNKRIVVAIMCLVVSTSCFATCPSNRLETCRSYVASKWDKLCKVMDKASGLRDELPSLPKSKWFSRDQESQMEEIDDLLEEASEILLSESSRDMLKQVKRLDERERELSEDVSEANKERILRPEKRAKFEEKIVKLTAEKEEVCRARLELKRAILSELRSLGVTVPETALEPFFSSVTCNSIIDTAVIFGNIVAVVKNLEELMQCDAVNARRYYGMYVVLLDIQIRCYRGFLHECESVWCRRLDSYASKIQKDRDAANEGAADPGFTAAQHEIYRRNVRMNEMMLCAVAAYRESLEKQRSAVASKMMDAERMRKVALNTYETISNAISLRDFLCANAETFEAVMKLEFPDLAAFNDAELVAEFQGITDKISADD